MISAIRNVAAELVRESGSATNDAPRTKDAGFGAEIRSAIGRANEQLNAAESKAEALSAGSADPVETILAISKADLALRHIVTLRNRVLEAYQEVMRLQL